MANDYYSALGVARGASEKDINAAFRKLAREYHPDLHPGDKKAEQRFKEISEAHRVLSDPEKRKRYDRFGPNWESMPPNAEEVRFTGGGPNFAGGGPNIRFEGINLDPEELRTIFGDMGSTTSGRSSFGDIFGSFASRRRSTAAPPPPEQELRITLKEALTGTTRRLILDGGREVEVKIPPGVTESTLLRVPGARVRVRISPHPQFTREGKNLRVAVSVPLATALLGGEVEVTTLKGGRAKLKISPETQNGTRLRLRGLGMPDMHGGSSGDLYAEVKVQLPLPPDEELRRWAEAHR